MTSFLRGVWILLIAAAPLAAQPRAVFRGNVLVDGNDAPIVGAEVSLPQLAIIVHTDSTGAFRIPGILAGRHQVSVRRVGFQSLVTVLDFVAGDSVDTDLLLAPVVTTTGANGQALPGVVVTAAAPVRGKLSEFEERRTMGAGGHFLTEEQLSKMEGRRMSEALATAGVPVVIGSTNAAWVASSRGTQSVLRGPKPTKWDVSKGAKPNACYAAVAVDGVLVYQGHEEEPLFDINSLAPNAIAGIEFYAGAASMPAKFNGTRNSCGLVLVWTK